MTPAAKSYFAALLTCLHLANPNGSWAKATLSEEEQVLWQATQADAKETNDKYMGRLLALRGNLIGLELLIAEKTNAYIGSRWGHSMLRFIDGDNDPLNDLVLGFVAEVDTPSLSLSKGLSGGYPVIPLVQPLRLFIASYVRDEGRPLERHIFPTSEGDRNEVIDTLAAWIAAPTDPNTLGR